MGILVTKKFKDAENGEPGFRILENCLECDGLPSEPIHVEVSGTAFTAESMANGTTILSFVVPRHIAQAMGLLPVD